MKIQTSRQFLARLALRRQLRRGRFTVPAVALIAGLSLFGADRSARAAGVTHTTATTTGNFSTATFSNGVPNSATTADIAEYNNTAGGSLVLDVPVSVGQLRNTNTGAFTLAAGAGTLTLDNTGGLNNPFGTANAFLGTTNSGTLTVAAPVALSNTNLGIGAANATGGAVTLSGALTATTAQSVFYRANGTGVVTDSGTIGASGGALAISNAGAGSGSVSLAGAVGGASGTAAPITVGNTATGSGTFTVGGTNANIIGASVSNITQDSAASTTVLTGVNNVTNGFAGAGATGTVTVTLGTLKLGTGSALGSVNNVTVTGGTFDVNANAETIGNLSDGGVSTGVVTDSGMTKALTLAGTTNFSGLISGALSLATSGTGTHTLGGTNTFTGNTTAGVGTTVVGTNTQAFGNPATNPLTQLSLAGATSTLSLRNDGGTGTVTGRTIIYGGPAGSATGYNVTAASGTINANNNGNAGSTGNTVQLGRLTQSTTGQVNFTSANGYGINFAGGLNSNAGTATLTINTKATPVSFANIVGTTARSLTVLGTGTVTDNGSVTATGGTAFGLFVGTGNSGGTTGNLVLKGTGSTITSGLTVSGGAATLFNADSLGGANAITLQQANATTLTTATLNLRNDADTTYGNNVTATSGTPAFNVDQASAGNTNHTLTLGTLATNQTVTVTNGHGYNLAFGAVSSTSAATFTNNMVNGTTTLASFTDSAASGQTLRFNGTSATANSVVSGVIAQNGANALAVAQSGAGILNLSGANTYTGTTTVSAGKLRLTNAGGTSATGTGAVTLNGGTTTTLAGTGFSSGLLTVTAGSRLAPAVNTGGANGNFGVPGTLWLGTTGGVTLTSANLDFDLAATATATSDLIATGGKLTITAANFIFNELTAGSLDTTAAYKLISGATASAFTVGSITGTVLQGDYTPTFSKSGNDLLVTFAPVPEPGTWAMMVGGLGLWLGARRLRGAARRKGGGPAAL